MVWLLNFPQLSGASGPSASCRRPDCSMWMHIDARGVGEGSPSLGVAPHGMERTLWWTAVSDPPALTSTPFGFSV